MSARSGLASAAAHVISQPTAARAQVRRIPLIARGPHAAAVGNLALCLLVLGFLYLYIPNNLYICSCISTFWFQFSHVAKSDLKKLTFDGAWGIHYHCSCYILTSILYIVLLFLLDIMLFDHLPGCQNIFGKLFHYYVTTID